VEGLSLRFPIRIFGLDYMGVLPRKNWNPVEGLSLRFPIRIIGLNYIKFIITDKTRSQGDT
jgi:hypothetical protein